MVIGGLIAHPFDAARDMLRFYRDAAAACTDELTVFAGLVHAPDGSGIKLAAMIVCHTGDPDTAERELAPFRAFGSPIMVEVGPMPYPVMNTLLDAGYPVGRAQLLALELHDGHARRSDRHGGRALRAVPSPMTAILFEHFHGAVTGSRPTTTAVPHREPGWNLLLPRCGWTRRTPARTSPGRGTHYAALGAPRRAPLAELPRPTTKPTTPSGPHTGRTTTGSSR